MTIRNTRPSRRFPRALAAAAVSLMMVLPGVLRAEPVDFSFEPPDIEAQSICIASPPNHVLTARWDGWNGGPFPVEGTRMVRRDLRLLRQLDARKWFDTVQMAIDKLQKSDPEYDQLDALLDHIDLLIDAGRTDEVRDKKLYDRVAELAQRSPRAKNALAEAYLSGIGVDRDPKRGVKYLIAAAYAGNSAALFKIAEQQVNGDPLPGWDIEPRLTVSLAFGSLVGNVDPLVCDRMNRIGAQYRTGELVQRDIPLSAQWYQLSADLGDAQAAWKVAQYHMESDGLDKDNDILLKYLKQAADADLSYAELEYGRVFERGALVPQDLEHAETLYREAADQGDINGLLRLATLYRTRLDGSVETDRRYARILAELAKRPGAPASVFVKLADYLVRTQGRWAAADEARALLEKAIEIEPDNTDALVRLARMRFRDADSMQDYYDIIDAIQVAILSVGRTEPMSTLQDVYRCRMPGAPQTEMASYWRDSEEAAGNVTIIVDRERLEQIKASGNAKLAAELQAQALYGRGRAVAQYYVGQQIAGLPGSQKAILGVMSDQIESPASRIALSRLRLAKDNDERKAALETLAKAARDGGSQARAAFLKALESPEVQADPAKYMSADDLEHMAREGDGEALEALARQRGGGPEARKAVYEEFADAVEARGDFPALMMALDFLQDPDRIDDYLGRARAVMQCGMHDVLVLAEKYHDLDREKDVNHWLNVARSMVGGEVWQMVGLADAYRELVSTDKAEAYAEKLYRRAYEQGDRVAMMRLLKLHEDPSDPAYDAAKRAALYIDTIHSSAPGDLPALLERISHEPDEVRSTVEAAVDVRKIYETAAKQGVPGAQLQVAKILRDEASQTGKGLKRSTELLQKAAAQGNAEAMMMLSRAYSVGLGVEPSIETSREWLRKAAEAGNVEAQNTVKLLDMKTEAKE